MGQAGARNFGEFEDQLEGEQALSLDKDTLLEGTKRRESESEEEVASLQADLETLDSQLDCALKIQKESTWFLNASKTCRGQGSVWKPRKRLVISYSSKSVLIRWRAEILLRTGLLALSRTPVI